MTCAWLHISSFNDWEYHNKFEAEVLFLMAIKVSMQLRGGPTLALVLSRFRSEKKDQVLVKIWLNMHCYRIMKGHLSLLNSHLGEALIFRTSRSQQEGATLEQRGANFTARRSDELPHWTVRGLITLTLLSNEAWNSFSTLTHTHTPTW